MRGAPPFGRRPSFVLLRNPPEVGRRLCFADSGSDHLTRGLRSESLNPRRARRASEGPRGRFATFGRQLLLCSEMCVPNVCSPIVMAFSTVPCDVTVALSCGGCWLVTTQMVPVPSSIW